MADRSALRVAGRLARLGKASDVVREQEAGGVAGTYLRLGVRQGKAQNGEAGHGRRDMAV